MSICEQRWGQKDSFLQRSNIIKELRRVHGSELDSLRESLEMLDILAGNRNLQSIVRENVKMVIDVEKLGIYQLVKDIGLERGLERGRLEGLQKAAVAMFQRGFSIVEIAAALELEESEVKTMLA